MGVLPFGPIADRLHQLGQAPFYKAVPCGVSLTPESARDLDALEEVIFIGYPANLFDAHNLTPIARLGTTATPVALPYSGQPAFLIDASVFPGSSGSPVFLMDRSGMHRSKDGTIIAGSPRFILLGVVAAMYEREVEADLIQTQARLAFKDPLNLGIVYKAWAIDECIDPILKAHGVKRAAAAVPQAA